MLDSTFIFAEGRSLRAAAEVRAGSVGSGTPCYGATAEIPAAPRRAVISSRSLAPWQQDAVQSSRLPLPPPCFCRVPQLLPDFKWVQSRLPGQA
jgi:hypothetical protein